jgi:hypothetical protein
MYVLNSSGHLRRGGFSIKQGSIAPSSILVKIKAHGNGGANSVTAAAPQLLTLVKTARII